MCTYVWSSQVVLVVKNLLANAGDVRDVGSVFELGRSPGGGNGNTLQYLAGESHGQRGLAGYSSWGHKSRGHRNQVGAVRGVTESQDTTEGLSTRDPSFALLTFSRVVS